MGLLRTHARGASVLALYLLVWGAAAAVLMAQRSVDFADAVSVFVVLGVLFPLTAWLLTLGRSAPPIAVARPRLELAAVLGFLALYAVFFVGYGLNAFHAAFPAVTRLSSALLLGLKLLVHVAAPAALLALLGARLAPLVASRTSPRAFWLTLVVLGGGSLALLCLVSPALRQIAAAQLSPVGLTLAIAGSFVWLALEAGLCEEFLFRAVLQTRLAAVMNTEAGAACVAALIFALAHVPGLWMRSGDTVAGHSKDLVHVIAYAVATLSPAGLYLGFVWSRTRSLLLVVLLHALIDVLPNTADFARLWF